MPQGRHLPRPSLGPIASAPKWTTGFCTSRKTFRSGKTFLQACQRVINLNKIAYTANLSGKYLNDFCFSGVTYYNDLFVICCLLKKKLLKVDALNKRYSESEFQILENLRGNLTKDYPG